jgi:hypothetical protein
LPLSLALSFALNRYPAFGMCAAVFAPSFLAS